MSASSEVILPKNFDIRKLSYGLPKQQATGGKTIFISYDSQQLYLQTPAMKAPFGVSMWPSDNGGPDKYSLDLSFEGRESREGVQAFFDTLQSIDKRLVIDAMENSQAWFKKKYASVEVVEALFSPTVRYSKDRETGEVTQRYAPTVKMTLPFKDGKFLFPSFGSRRDEIDLLEAYNSARTKGARFQVIFQISAIWVVGSKFGAMLKVRQLKMEETVRLSGYAFQATEEDAPEDDEDVAAAAKAPVVRRIAAPPAAAANKLMMAESEEEEEEAGKAAPQFVDDEGIEP
jgi:hypothetical protein